jgi:hypothetical protein
VALSSYQKVYKLEVICISFFNISAKNARNHGFKNRPALGAAPFLMAGIKKTQ